MPTCWRTGSSTSAKLRADELHARVLFLPSPDRIAVAVDFPGNIRDGGSATAPPLQIGKALDIEEAIKRETEPLAPGSGREPGKAHRLAAATIALLNKSAKPDA